MKVFTIGFTKKTAEEFFGALGKAGVERVVDVRLNNESQLAGFSKRRDLEYFLKHLLGIEYLHVPSLAPTRELLGRYRKKEISWLDYEGRFVELMRERIIEEQISRDVLQGACLLCSEELPDRCHRRLVAEYLQRAMGDIEVSHL